jgi:hypothetical protein
VPCPTVDCPLCALVGPPSSVRVPVKIVDTGEMTMMTMSFEKAQELGILPRPNDAISRLSRIKEDR